MFIGYKYIYVLFDFVFFYILCDILFELVNNLFCIMLSKCKSLNIRVYSDVFFLILCNIF